MEIRSELEIAAPAAEVWGILTDFPRYQEWNPFITEIESDGVVGGSLRLLLSLPEGRDYRLKSTLLRIEENFELRWRAHLLFPGLFDGEHFLRLIELDPRRTRFVQGENFSGVLLRFSGRTLTQVARGFDYMNEALKRRAEANSHPTTSSATRSADLSGARNRVG
ncbi:MAG TPA: SRPBCC domain-containing protein [Polyangiaceae bacterium]|nr:SRPBCC domain-containing protein [Polyangiaceae bacterium]